MVTVIQNLFVIVPLLLSTISSIYISIAVVGIGLKELRFHGYGYFVNIFMGR